MQELGLWQPPAKGASSWVCIDIRVGVSGAAQVTCLVSAQGASHAGGRLHGAQGCHTAQLFWQGTLHLQRLQLLLAHPRPAAQAQPPLRTGQQTCQDNCLVNW